MTSHRTEIQVRFNDTDALGHLNNVAFAVYAEHARVELFAAQGERSNLILAHLALDFRRQVHYGDRVHVLTWVEGLGRSSVRLYQEIFANERVAAEVRSVVVIFDFAAQRSAPIPDALRRKLERYARTQDAGESPAGRD